MKFLSAIITLIIALGNCTVHAPCKLILKDRSIIEVDHSGNTNRNKKNTSNLSKKEIDHRIIETLIL